MTLLEQVSKVVAEANDTAQGNHMRRYEALGEELSARKIQIADIEKRVATFDIAIPSWGTGTGGTRFARFPGAGEPEHVFDKLQDCAVVNMLSRATSSVSLHFPWDGVDPEALKATGRELGLKYDAVNSNTFQDQADQPLSYKFGSLSHTDMNVRAQAVAHNIRCLEIGHEIGAPALTVWVGDGTNFPGQQDMSAQLDRYMESMAQIYEALPEGMQLFVEHKIYEPAFYSTVVQDWGTSWMIAQELGPKAQCLVDLGHHAPNVNVEMIVSRLARVGRLGGFHFNDSKYGDDDLDSGSIDPFRLFLVMCEVVFAEDAGQELSYMIDQSHNVTDPIESLIRSAGEARRAYAQALLVDSEALAAAQQENDALGASEILKTAFRTDVEPLLAAVRASQGGAVDPIAAFRMSGYRDAVAQTRASSSGSGGGII